MKYYDDCIREVKEAHDAINSQGGYVSSGDTMGQMLSAGLSNVLSALESYDNMLKIAKEKAQSD